VFDGNISEADIDNYGLKTLDAQFLFDDNLHKFLSEVRNRVAIWSHANSAAEREPTGAEKLEYRRIMSEHLQWIREQGDQRFAARFVPFLVYKPAKNPWYLRCLPALDA
jgi:hypothetical protein